MKQSKTFFERKAPRTEEIQTRFYTLAKVYWTGIPLLYFFMLSSAQRGTGGFESMISDSPEIVIEMLGQFSNAILALLLFGIAEKEQTKTGLAGFVFKVAMIQQLFVGNLFGAGIAFLAHRELPTFRPENSDTQEKKMIEKTVVFVSIGLLIVISLVVGYGRWAL
ncbi:hypothetical protein [Atopococcus tabaci]|uniref:hypothetical protein n=1 Tax=Atopococcus tabaci TaxID=269774 RepID=UPI00240A3B6C|nr:hypothetical protein [Atopococcus tabaci]